MVSRRKPTNTRILSMSSPMERCYCDAAYHNCPQAGERGSGTGSGAVAERYAVPTASQGAAADHDADRFSDARGTKQGGRDGHVVGDLAISPRSEQEVISSGASSRRMFAQYERPKDRRRRSVQHGIRERGGSVPISA